MFPTELITMLGSAAMAGLGTIWKGSLDARKMQTELSLMRSKQQIEAWREARNVDNTHLHVTRRWVTLMAVFAIIVWPKVAAVFWPELNVMVGYYEWNPGFWPFTDGRDIVEWRESVGLTITPLDTHMISAIVGLYFGHRVGK